MKRFGYTELYSTFDNRVLSVWSTHPKVIEYVHDAAKDLNFSGQNSKINFSHLNREAFRLRIERTTEELKSLIDMTTFRWIVIKKMCSEGWEPFPLADLDAGELISFKLAIDE